MAAGRGLGDSRHMVCRFGSKLSSTGRYRVCGNDGSRQERQNCQNLKCSLHDDRKKD